MIGRLLAAPIRILNSPLRAVEKILDVDNQDERVLSVPLEKMAEAVEEAVAGENA